MQKKDLNFMNSVQIPNPKKSVFDLTHDVKMSANMGYLIPAMVMDCVPGDRVSVSNSALVRFAPMVAPIMHRVNVTFHTWAIPYRILWPGWSDYITETKTGGVLPAFPFVKVHNNADNYTQLLDYLGVPLPPGILAPPPSGWADESISAMRLAAYQCVYNEFYRDENLITPVPFELSDGDNTAALSDLGVLRKRAWVHDYFTSNLPFAQKGDPVSIPIGDFGDVPVKIQPVVDYPLPGSIITNAGAQPNLTLPNEDPTWQDVGNQSSAYADTSTLQPVATTINDLRLAEQLQKYLERAARAGTRLVEWIKGMFDEVLPDYTAQRPQYIGGSITPVQISEVLNTAGGALPQGNMSGRGISLNSGKQGKYRVREHCVIMTFMSVMPETAYQNGLDREWTKINDPKDFLNPLFARIGEQATLNKELAAYTGDGSDTFGYLPRYAEYRTLPNRVAGDFRTSLSYWHMGRQFDVSTFGVPGLNQAFIEADPTHRVFADTNPNDQKLYIHVLNQVRAVRPLPKYGTPSL